MTTESLESFVRRGLAAQAAAAQVINSLVCAGCGSTRPPERGFCPECGSTLRTRPRVSPTRPLAAWEDPPADDGPPDDDA